MNVLNKILLFIKTPPPVTGATLMNQRVHDSKLLHENFLIRSICISYADSVENLGRLGLKKSFTLIRVFFKLLYELLFQRPNLVYFQISPLGLAFLRDLLFVSLIKVLRIKIVFHLRGKGIYIEAQKRWKKALYKYTFKGQSIICLSHLLTYDIQNVYNGRAYVVNNGIPDVSEKFKAITAIKEKPTIKILFLSNLIISKGILDFLEALELLNKKGILFQGTIVGAEANLSKRDLFSEIQNRRVSNVVTYLGPKYGHEKTKIISESDILVFPTKNDIWGNVILEAMQLGIPIIASKEGAIPEIIDDGKTGFVVEKSSPEQIAEKIQVLIENPVLRKKMGLAGRKKYEEKYTLEHFESNLTNVFHEVLNKLNDNN
jgi:glycosyltransferase involved in cell wall biosynthesis